MARLERSRRPVRDLNALITCHLCRGYLIDATTVVECLHSFCRTCIVTHLESNTPKAKHCPTCDIVIHKTKPKEAIRSDPTLQDIVYKLVPGLYKNEMERRKEFYSREPQSSKGLTNEEKGELSGERLIFSPKDHIYLSIQYFPQKISHTFMPYTKNNEPPLTGQLNGKSDGQRRYLKCEALMRVIHLKKWLKNKFNVRDSRDIDIFYKYDPLLDDYTMIDLAYIYSWRRNGPLCLYYKIVEPKSAKRQSRPARVPSKVAKLSKLAKVLANDKSKQSLPTTDTAVSVEPKAKPRVKSLTKKRKPINESNLITTNPVNEPLPPVDSHMALTIEHMLSHKKAKPEDVKAQGLTSANSVGPKQHKNGRKLPAVNGNHKPSGRGLKPKLAKPTTDRPPKPPKAPKQVPIAPSVAINKVTNPSVANGTAPAVKAVSASFEPMDLRVSAPSTPQSVTELKAETKNQSPMPFKVNEEISRASPKRPLSGLGLATCTATPQPLDPLSQMQMQMHMAASDLMAKLELIRATNKLMPSADNSHKLHDRVLGPHCVGTTTSSPR